MMHLSLVSLLLCLSPPLVVEITADPYQKTKNLHNGIFLFYEFIFWIIDVSSTNTKHCPETTQVQFERNIEFIGDQIRSKKKPQKEQCLTLCCFLKGVEGCVWGGKGGEVNMVGVLNLPTKKIFQSPIYLIKYRENFFFSDIQICIISGG